MELWRITPVADAADPRWQGSPVWSEVLVAAENPALARAVAATLDTAKLRQPARHEDNGSRFLDEKLYRVDRVEPADLSENAAAELRAAPSAGARVISQSEAAPRSDGE